MTTFDTNPPRRCPEVGRGRQVGTEVDGSAPPPTPGPSVAVLGGGEGSGPLSPPDTVDEAMFSCHTAARCGGGPTRPLVFFVGGSRTFSFCTEGAAICWRNSILMVFLGSRFDGFSLFFMLSFSGLFI